MLSGKRLSCLFHLFVQLCISCGKSVGEGRSSKKHISSIQLVVKLTSKGIASHVSLLKLITELGRILLKSSKKLGLSGSKTDS